MHESSTGQHEKIQALHVEKTNSFPEIISNPPLENTAFVYSIPVYKEWKNGHLLRQLRALLSQKVNPNHPLEAVFVINIGNKLADLAQVDSDGRSIRDNQGNVLLQTDESQLTEPDSLDAIKYLQEANETLVFLRKVVEMERLSRELLATSRLALKKRQQLKKAMASILAATPEYLQKDILQLAVNKAGTISITVADAIQTAFPQTDYRAADLSTFRTLGMDIIEARFAAFDQKPIVNLYDADTVPESNQSVAELQSLFESNPKLMYVFTGISHIPSGHSEKLFAGFPQEALSRAADHYNTALNHGSPQICFRLEAYQQLGEIAQYTSSGFHGHEDFDTGLKLIYHFGLVQEGLLFEESLSLVPTALTSDRLDGYMDSQSRLNRFNSETEDTLNLNLDVDSIARNEKKIHDLINEQPAEKKQKILHFLAQTKQSYERHQKLLNRFNKRVITSFIQAYEQGLIKTNRDHVEYQAKTIAQLPAGTALLHYLEVNKNFVAEVLNKEEDILVIKYFLGLVPSLPENLKELSRFQSAVREYLGKPLAVTDVFPDQQASAWGFKDHRLPNDKDSLLYPLIAETLALGRTYSTFFETPELRDVSASRKRWPTTPNNKDILDWQLGDHDTRIAKVKDKLPMVSKNSEDTPAQPWYQTLRLPSFPMLGLFKQLTKK